MIYLMIMFHDSVPHIHIETSSKSHTHQKDHEENHHHHDFELSDEPSFLSRLISALEDHHNAIETDHFDDNISLITD